MATKRAATAAYDLRDLTEGFVIALSAANRSEKTEKAYRLGIGQYIAWCEANGKPVVMDRAQVQAWMVDMRDRGLAPNTVAQRLAGVRQLSKWMTDPAEGGVLDADPLLRLNAPKVDTAITPVLTEDQLKAMLKACQGPEFRDRRDEAMVRLMAETGARVNEVLGLDVTDIDLPRGLAYIRRGKGGKGRIVPFGPQTAKAMDRYLRARRTHPGADMDAAFLTARQRRRLADHGLRRTIGQRAEAAGIDNFHPHMFRHTAASRWLAAGGSEGGLMAVAGWSDRAMLDRYVRATAAERAATESRNLRLGDL
jgi:site-specific recombinase XerD